MAEVRTICVYCGSQSGSDAEFSIAAARLGQLFAAAGIKMVYGGGSNGLMGIVAKSVIQHGGHVTGIIPHFLATKEIMLENADELVVTQDMHERKRKMFDRADAFVALPGGVGTLEEVAEQLAWIRLGQHSKPLILLDVNGFWQPLQFLLNEMARQHFLPADFESYFKVASTPEDVLRLLS